MPHKRKYRKIAGFLLVIFSLNSVVGFACSVGLDMGFNSKHHHDGQSTEAIVHVHADGKKHVHSEKKNGHNHERTHEHSQASNHQESGNKKDNCCNDEVAQLVQLDKSVPESINIIHPIFLTAFLDAFYTVILPSGGFVKDIKQFVRSYHPPISNIRIAIQSFQI